MVFTYFFYTIMGMNYSSRGYNTKLNVVVIPRALFLKKSWVFDLTLVWSKIEHLRFCSCMFDVNHSRGKIEHFGSFKKILKVPQDVGGLKKQQKKLKWSHN